MNYATIAGLQVEYSFLNRSFFDQRLSSYTSTHLKEPDLRIKTVALDHIDPPEGELIAQVKLATLVRTKEQKVARSVLDRASGKIGAVVYSAPEYSEVEIHLLKNRQHPVFTLTDYEYMYSGFAFNDRITELGGTVLHGSAVAIYNQGIVFSANSGVGKSTQASLWKQCFGEELTIINDDKPAIKFHEGKPFLYGTPWSGKTDLNTNMCVPLTAIIFIKRSASNFIERLKPKDAIFHLSSQIERPYYDSKLGIKTLDIISRLIEEVPIYRLYCNISYQAVQAVYHEIFRRENV